jgi:hypothetical protein
MSQEMCILQCLDKKCWTPRICAFATHHDPNNYDYCCQADGNTSLLNKEAWTFRDFSDDSILDGIDTQYITPDVARIALRYDGYNIVHIPKEILTHDMAWYIVKERAKYIKHIPAHQLTQEMIWYVLRDSMEDAFFIPKDRLTHDMIWFILENNPSYKDILYWVPNDMITQEMIWHVIKEKPHYIEELMYKVSKNRFTSKMRDYIIKNVNNKILLLILKKAS